MWISTLKPRQNRIILVQRTTVRVLGYQPALNRVALFPAREGSPFGGPSGFFVAPGSPGGISGQFTPCPAFGWRIVAAIHE